MSLKNKILWLLLLSLATAGLSAAFVEADTAVSAARNWLAQSPDGKSCFPALKQVLHYQAGALAPLPRFGEKAKPNDALLYLVEFQEGQYALVAAEDNSIPVLAYSSEAAPGLDTYPPAFYALIEAYGDQISALRDSGGTHPENQAGWQELLSGANPYAHRSTRSVIPLIRTMWNQDWPYNELCPVDNSGPGGHVYAGCVATAMAMVMKYWNHPTTGVGSNTYYAPGYGYQSANFGSTTYLWDEMPNSVSGSSIPVATLMYHCGVAVNMNYAPDGSGAQSTAAADAYNDHFRYPTAEIVDRSSYSLANWNNLMKAQIDNGSPMYYSGGGSGGGHAFVLDGYDTADYFHFNFGWGGSSNGYFYVNNLNGFNYYQSAIINSIPENYSIANIMIRMNAAGVTVGQSFPLTVTTNPILGSWGVNSFTMQVYYEHPNVVFDGVALDNTIASGGNVTWTESSPGIIEISWNASANATLMGGGDLIKLMFTPQDAGQYLFDIINMQYNNSTIANTLYLMVDAAAPVATLAASQISMTNVMHLGYQEIGTTELRTTYLLPSWNVGHYQFDLGYDPAKLEYIGIETTGTLSEGATPQVAENSPGTLSISADGDTDWQGGGTLLNIMFRAIGNGSALSVTQVAPSNFYYNSTPISAVSGANFILSPMTPNDDEVLTPVPRLAVWPNPIRGQANLKLQGGLNQQASLRIFNVKGQLVRSVLLDDTRSEYVWDAKDDRGARLASGIYFISWAQGNHQGRSKVLIVR